MSAVVPSIEPSLFALVRSALPAWWRELAPLVGIGAIVAGSAAPAALAAVTGAPLWFVAVAAAPAALALAGLAHVGAAVASGERARVRQLVRADVVLALLALTTAASALWLCTLAEPLRIAGYAAAAVWLAIIPRALSYGAVRDRRGLGALRGGAILAAYRPGATLTLLGLGVLGGFAVVASLGTLALVVPALLAIIAARVTAAELSAIDAVQVAS